jgi:hypothetical protein
VPSIKVKTRVVPKRHVRRQAMVNLVPNQQHISHVKRKKSVEIRDEPVQKERRRQ